MAKAVRRHRKRQIYTIGETSRSARKKNTVLYAVLFVIIFLLVAAIVYLLFTLMNRQNPSPSPTGGTPSSSPAITFTPVPTVPNSPSVRTPLVELKTDEKGDRFHRITFYGEKGQVVYIPELNKRLTFTSSELQYDIPDKDWIGQSPVASSVDVTLYPRMILEDSTVLPIDTIHYSISVESSSITMVTPSNTSTSTPVLYNDNYTIRFITPLTSTVKVNGVDVTHRRDTSGLITYSHPLTPTGAQDIVITVSEPYKFPCTKTITVVRPELPVTFSIDNINTRTKNARVTITGKVDPEATIKCNDVPLVGPVKKEADGTFSLTILLERYGYTTVNFFAEKEVINDNNEKERISSCLQYDIYWEPNVDEYSRKAWALDSSVMTNPYGYLYKTFLFSNVKVVNGAVEKYPTVFEAEVTINDSNGTPTTYTCYFKYTGTFEFRNGETFRIFADIIGMRNGSPLCIIYEGYGLID